MRRLITVTVLLSSACGGEKKATPPPTPTAPTPADASAPTITAADLAHALRAAGAVPATGAFQVEEVTDASVKLVYMSDEGGTREEVKALSTRLVLATVDALKRRRRDLRTTTVAAVVNVTAPEGVSGGERMSPLGRANYDGSADEVFFEEHRDAVQPSLVGRPEDRRRADRGAPLRVRGVPHLAATQPGRVPEEARRPEPARAPRRLGRPVG